jgi:hypothetical protein
MGCDAPLVEQTCRCRSNKEGDRDAEAAASLPHEARQSGEALLAEYRAELLHPVQGWWRIAIGRSFADYFNPELFVPGNRNP